MTHKGWCVVKHQTNKQTNNFVMTQKKYPQNLHTPKNIRFFWNPKNIEVQNFEPPKNSPSLRMYKNIRVPPGVGMKYIDWYAIHRNPYNACSVGDGK